MFSLINFVKRTPDRHPLSLSVVLIVFVILTSACEPIDRLRNMDGTTEDVRETTEDLKKTTQDEMTALKEYMEAMGLSIDDLQDLANGGLSLLRKNMTKTSRDHFLNEMRNSYSFENKVATAGYYFWSFEFQAWLGNAEDTLTSRDQLFYEAMREFYPTMMEYNITMLRKADLSQEVGELLLNFCLMRSLNAQAYLDDLISGNGDLTETLLNRRVSYLALSAVLHEVNSLQATRVREQLLLEPIQPVSVLDLIQNALLMTDDIDRNVITKDNVPRHVHEILGFYPVTINILQTRVITLSTAALIYTARLPGMPGKDSGFFLARRYNKWISDVWKVPYESLETEELRKYTQYMDWAIETQKFLVDYGEPAEFAGIAQELFVKMNEDDFDFEAYNEEAGKKEAMLELRDRFHTMRQLSPELAPRR